jgi:uronate dehydrogenase
MAGLALIGRLFAGARRFATLPGGLAPGTRVAARARLPATPPNLARPVRRAVVTGASGQVASLLLPWMRRTGLALDCVDRRGGPGVPSDGPVRRVELRDAAAAVRTLRGADAVLHLAAASSETRVEDLAGDNAVALANVLQAAVREGVGRIVFASTMHVVGLYGRDEPLDEGSPVRPDSHYAASKLHGEALCRLYAEKHGLSVTCLRLGHVAATLEEAEPGAWISPQDVAQLVEIAFRRDSPGFELFHAVADYAGSPLAPSRATAFGYRCRRPAETHAQAMARVARTWRDDPVARQKRGATFASGPLPS